MNVLHERPVYRVYIHERPVYIQDQFDTNETD